MTVKLQNALLSGQSAHTRISLALLDVLAIPLADTGTTRIREHKTANVFEGADHAITFNRGSNLF